MTVDWKSTRNWHCRSTLPGPMGMAVAAEAFAAELEPDAGRPQAVPHGNLDAVLRGEPRHLVTPGEETGPVIDILLSVGQNLLFARGAGGGVDAHDPAGGDRQQRIRIAGAQIVGAGEGQPADIREGPDLFRTHAGLPEPLAVKRGTAVSVRNRPLQAFQLVVQQLRVALEMRHKGLVMPSLQLSLISKNVPAMWQK